MIKQPFPKCNGRFLGCGRGIVAALLIVLCFAPKIAGADVAGAAVQSDDGSQEVPLTEAADPALDVSFPTFTTSGLDVCTDDDGKPVILLFSSASCSHCEWGGEIFDFMVMYYVANGLISAHHYDVNTGDDLLTEETETVIPMAYLELKAHGNPGGLVPYYNFGCKYERIGNGYERRDDPVGEAAEMRQVIEALVKMTSGVD